MREKIILIMVLMLSMVFSVNAQLIDYDSFNRENDGYIGVTELGNNEYNDTLNIGQILNNNLVLNLTDDRNLVQTSVSVFFSDTSINETTIYSRFKIDEDSDRIYDGFGKSLAPGDGSYSWSYHLYMSNYINTNPFRDDLYLDLDEYIEFWHFINETYYQTIVKQQGIEVYNSANNNSVTNFENKVLDWSLTVNGEDGTNNGKSVIYIDEWAVCSGYDMDCGFISEDEVSVYITPNQSVTTNDDLTAVCEYTGEENIDSINYNWYNNDELLANSEEVETKTLNALEFKDFDNYNDSWDYAGNLYVNENFLIVPGGCNGILLYYYNETTETLTLTDSDYQGNDIRACAEYLFRVNGDNDYVYTANMDWGIDVYRLNKTEKTLDFIYTEKHETGTNAVFPYNDFLFLATWNDDVQIYEINRENGSLTYLDNKINGYTEDLFLDGTFLYASKLDDGIDIYPLDEINGIGDRVANIDTHSYSIWSNGNGYFYSAGENGLEIYTITETGIVELQETITDYSAESVAPYHVWGEDNYLYLSTGLNSSGIIVYERDEINGNLTELFGYEYGTGDALHAYINENYVFVNNQFEGVIVYEKNVTINSETILDIYSDSILTSDYTSESDNWKVSCQFVSGLSSSWFNSSEVNIGRSSTGGSGGSRWPETTQKDTPVKTTEQDKFPLMSLVNLDIDLDKVKAFFMDNIVIIGVLTVIGGLYFGNASKPKRRKKK
jgi:hypothetical protein